MAEITIERATSPTDEIRALIDELDRELMPGYLPEQHHGLTVDAIFRPDMRFFVVRLDGATVGCGGVAFLETFAEVKRLYVRPGARGRGIAQLLLSRLELETIRHGLDLLRLETGDRQPAAIRLYERAGFQCCEPFGEYATMPPLAIATSIFYEKHLNTTLSR